MSDVFFTEADAQTVQNIEKGKEKNGKQIDMLTKHLYLTYLVVGILAFSIGIYVSYKRLKNE